MSDRKPLYQRDEAYPEDATDLVLVLAAEDGATYETIREQLEEVVLDAMVIEIENIDEPVEPHLGPDAEPESREPFDSLRLLDNVDYVEGFSVPHYGDEEIVLTEKGEEAVEVLRRGMLSNQREALSDIGVESAPRVADGAGEQTTRLGNRVLRTKDRADAEELRGPPGTELVPADETHGMEQHKELIQEELEDEGFGRLRLRALSEFWIIGHTNTLTDRERERFVAYAEGEDHWQKLADDPIGEVWGVSV